MSEVTQQSGTRFSLLRIAPYARMVMGLLFLVAGAAKVWSPVQFYWEAHSYLELLEMNREMWPELARMLLLLGPIECGIGLALLSNWQPRYVLPVATVAMVVFVAVTFYNWQQGANLDCGCFGALVDRSPGEAVVEDGIMLLLLLVAWRWGTDSLPSHWPPAGHLVKLGTIATLLVLAVRFYPEADRVENSDLKAGVELTGIGLEGSDVDLSEGEYLIELFNPHCSRCKKAVPKLNRYAQSADIPAVIALNVYAQDSEDLSKFREQMRPKFDIATISTSDWKRLTWNHGWPRMAYVRDGVVERVWEHFEMPTIEQLKLLTGGS